MTIILSSQVEDLLFPGYYDHADDVLAYMSKLHQDGHRLVLITWQYNSINNPPSHLHLRTDKTDTLDLDKKTGDILSVWTDNLSGVDVFEGLDNDIRQLNLTLLFNEIGECNAEMSVSHTASYIYKAETFRHTLA